MHELKLLILDEPTAGVDIELRRSMWGFLKDLTPKAPPLFPTTHYLKRRKCCGRNIGIIQEARRAGGK